MKPRSTISATQFLRSVDASGTVGTFAHGMHTYDNPTYVFPASGFKEGELYNNMIAGGFTTFSSTDPDSVYVDIHTVITYDSALTLNPDDTLRYYIALISVENGTSATVQSSADAASQWAMDHVYPAPGCCIGTRGDVSGDGADLDIVDLGAVVDFLFNIPPVIQCDDEADVNGDGSVADIVDLGFIR